MPLGAKVTPAGNPAETVKVGAGTPVAVTIKDPGVPAVKVVDAELVICGAGDASTAPIVQPGAPERGRGNPGPR